MRPAHALTLRSEYADDPVWLARLPQQGTEAPQVRDADSGAVMPQGPKGDGDGKVNGGGGQDPMSSCLSPQTLLMFGAMFAVMYFFIIRPQRKQEQERQALLASVKAGDKIVTTGGIHGVIESVSEKTVRIQVDEVLMTIDRAAVGRVERDPAPATAS